jgi:predicted transcriptional regulator
LPGKRESKTMSLSQQDIAAIERLFQMRRDGKNCQEIAEALGIKSKQAVSACLAVLKRAGVDVPASRARRGGALFVKRSEWEAFQAWKASQQQAA